jgi:hypothetical protein
MSDPESRRLLWKLCIGEKTNLDGQKLKATLDEFTMVGLR